MMRINRNTKGFTLIELLIVVAIIGILAAIAIPAYSGYTAKSKMSAVLHTMGAIKNAVLAYYNEAGHVNTSDITGNGNAATNFGGALNIDVPTQYASAFRVTGNTAVITATLANNIGGGVAAGDTVTATPNTAVAPWTWTWTGSTTAVTKLMPKQ